MSFTYKTNSTLSSVISFLRTVLKWSTYKPVYSNFFQFLLPSVTVAVSHWSLSNPLSSIVILSLQLLLCLSWHLLTASVHYNICSSSFPHSLHMCIPNQLLGLTSSVKLWKLFIISHIFRLVILSFCEIPANHHQKWIFAYNMHSAFIDYIFEQ